MKPEPLKNKSEEMYVANEDKDVIYFRKENVASAVEWLKEEIDRIRCDNSECFSNILEIINEAFADVVEEEK